MSFCVCMVCIFILISLFGVHSSTERIASGMVSSGGIYLVSLFCLSVKFVLLYYICCILM